MDFIQGVDRKFSIVKFFLMIIYKSIKWIIVIILFSVLIGIISNVFSYFIIK